jgi:hypothetical protein
MLDFSREAWESGLPKPGRHNATLEDLRFNPKEDVTWCVFAWRLDEGGVVEELHAIDAPRDSRYLQSTASGKRRVETICNAIGIEPQFENHDDIESKLLGAEVDVIVAITTKDGMRVPVIRGVEKRVAE